MSWSPVVDYWLKNTVTANRAAAGVLCVIPRDFLSRSDVVISYQILTPLIKFHGLRLSVHVIAGEVEKFFLMGRPAGKPAVSRLLAALCYVIR